MAQVKFGNCVRYGPRPNLVPSQYPGYFTPSLAPSCKLERPYVDGQATLHSKRTNYAKGSPVMSHLEGTDNLVGIASKHTGDFETVQTQEGPVVLPKMGPQRTGYMPTTAQLNALPYTDSRFTGISDRYYNH